MNFPLIGRRRRLVVAVFADGSVLRQFLHAAVVTYVIKLEGRVLVSVIIEVVLVRELVAVLSRVLAFLFGLIIVIAVTQQVFIIEKPIGLPLSGALEAETVAHFGVACFRLGQHGRPKRTVQVLIDQVRSRN